MVAGFFAFLVRMSALNPHFPFLVAMAARRANLRLPVRQTSTTLPG